MDITKEIESLKKPETERAITFLTSLLKKHLPMYVDYVAVVPKQELEDLKEETSTERLLQYWRKLQQETKYCTYALKPKSALKPEFNWILSDANTKAKHKPTFTGNSLEAMLRDLCTFIETTRIPAKDGDYEFQMPIIEE